MSGAKEQTRAARCSNCGATFKSPLTHHGRYRRTCSPGCHIESLDRMIAGLVRKRDELVAEVEQR